MSVIEQALEFEQRKFSLRSTDEPEIEDIQAIEPPVLEIQTAVPTEDNLEDSRYT